VRLAASGADAAAGFATALGAAAGAAALLGDATGAAALLGAAAGLGALVGAAAAGVTAGLDLALALVEEDLRKIEAWTARHGVAIADWPSAPIDPFFNVNTPEDAARAAHIALQHSGG